MSINIDCGNGGDYEYVRDTHYWEIWIKKNLGTDKFTIIPHKEADKGILTFEDEQFEIIFRLKAPPWISHKDLV